MRANSLSLNVIASSAAASFGDHSRSTACTSGVFRLEVMHARTASRRDPGGGRRPRAARMVFANVGGSGLLGDDVDLGGAQREPGVERRRERRGLTLSHGGTPPYGPVHAREQRILVRLGPEAGDVRQRPGAPGRIGGVGRAHRWGGGATGASGGQQGDPGQGSADHENLAVGRGSGTLVRPRITREPSGPVGATSIWWRAPVRTPVVAERAGVPAQNVFFFYTVSLQGWPVRGGGDLTQGDAGDDPRRRSLGQLTEEY